MRKPIFPDKPIGEFFGQFALAVFLPHPIDMVADFVDQHDSKKIVLQALVVNQIRAALKKGVEDCRVQGEAWDMPSLVFSLEEAGLLTH